ncbi:MAG: lipoprotein-releasing ABC transporter permease subunit [Rhodospirillaceae bacterium]|nr:lipoprotein-releasing ABC transporter permease subunit [Rhodospirillaceae bacterium]
MVAFRYLRARRKEGFVSVIAGFSFAGIMLGVATLIIVMSVMNGFRTELLSRILGVNGHLAVYALGGRGIPEYDALAQRIRGVDGVTYAMPVVEGQVMATANGVNLGALVHGIAPDDLRARPIFADNIRFGDLGDFQGADAAVIGERMAQKMGISVGDRITLISPKGQATVFGSVPRVRSYAVAAIFKVGMSEYDGTYVFIPMAAAQVFFIMPDRASQIDIGLIDADATAGIAPKINRMIGSGLSVYDWRHANSSFFNAVQVERNVMFLILTLIILVAAFNIVSGLIMLVKDKGRDIAIMRTMGATRGAILRIFLMTGASIGVVGTMAGVVLGLTFCANIEHIRRFIESLSGANLFNAEIYFLSKLPAEVDPSEVVTVVVMALVLSLAATIYPAWRAARLDPVEALRYE